jgi:PPOX class probable F420-dependent enzyme
VAHPVDDPATRAEAFLRTSAVVWLSTVRPDGRPHLVPIWFWWDGASILIATKPQARKVANLRTTPDCMVAIGDAGANFDVALIEARAELVETPTSDLLDAGLFAKYRALMAEVGLTRATFERLYSQVVRITPTRCLPWRGVSPDDRRATVSGLAAAAG